MAVIGPSVTVPSAKLITIGEFCRRTGLSVEIARGLFDDNRIAGHRNGATGGRKFREDSARAYARIQGLNWSLDPTRVLVVSDESSHELYRSACGSVGVDLVEMNVDAIRGDIAASVAHTAAMESCPTVVIHDGSTEAAQSAVRLTYVVDTVLLVSPERPRGYERIRERFSGEPDPVLVLSRCLS